MELHSHHIQVWRSHIRQWQISSRKQVLLPSPTQLNQNPLHHTQIQSSRRQMRQTMMIKANNKKPRRSLVNTTPPERRSAMELGLFIPNPDVADNKIIPSSVHAHATNPGDCSTDNIAKHFLDKNIEKFKIVYSTISPTHARHHQTSYYYCCCCC